MKKLLSVLLALTLILASASALADATLTVSASAQVHMDADCAHISMGVSRTCPTVAAASAEVADAIEAITAALTEAGVDAADISTHDYSVSPAYDWSGDEAVIKGYAVSHMLSVTVRDAEQAGRIVDVAAGAGANEMYGLTFTGSKQAEAYDQALTAAVAEARRKGDLTAAAAGMKITGVASITEGTAVTGPVVTFRSEEAVADKAAGTQLHNSGTVVEACVTVTFTME